MTLSPSPLEEATEAQAAASPLTRIGEARWILLTALFAAGSAVIAYEVPVTAAAAAMAALTLAAAFVPRRSVSRRVKLNEHREIRRMWPGTGMKVTVDALPTPCFVADGRGIIRYVNAHAQTLYSGVKPGNPLSFFLRAPSLLEAVDRVCATGGTERINWTERVPTETWYEAHIAPIYMPGTDAQERTRSLPDFILVVIQDLTENRRLERMRTDFVANASHELRTPLASLTGFIETIQGAAKNDPEAQDRFLSIMLDQARRMRRLIDDILSLSRIELKAHVRPENRVDLTDILRHTSDALSPLAAEMNVEIRMDVPEKPVEVKGDRDELIQVAENLVENALKYGSSGKYVDLSLAQQRDADGALWVLSVRDYGEGIPREHLPRLTERFYRIETYSSRAMKGTGLGLAIVKHIITRHRGRLDIESEPGEGATFKVTLPATQEPDDVSGPSTA